MSLPREHSTLADRLTDVATLIGERQPEEVELQTGKRVIPGLGLQNEATWLTQKAGQLRFGALKMVVCGGVSAGKSTFINAIADTKLPMGATAKTGAVCEVVSGSNADTFVVSYAGGEERSMDLDEFTSFSALSPGSIKDRNPFPLSNELSQVRYVRTESSSAFSESGITIVDTLGFNAGPLAEEITSNHLQTADVVLMALSSRPPFKQTDVDFLAERLDGLDPIKRRKLLYVINDFNLSDSEREDVLSGARAQLTGLVEDFDREVFVVNALDALVARQPDVDREKHDELLAKHNGEISEVLESTGLPQLERVIEESFESGGAWQMIQKATVNGNVRPALREARDNIVRRRTGLTTDASELDEAVAEAQDAFKSSRRQKDQTLDLFNAFTRDLADRVCNSFDKHFVIKPGQRPIIDKARWRESWAKVAPQIGFWKLAAGIVNNKRREELKAQVHFAIEALIQGQMAIWTDGLSRDLEPTLERFQGELTVSITDFQKGLDTIVNQFAATGAPGVSFLDPVRSDQNAQRIIQGVVRIITGDPNLTIGSVLAPSLRSFFRRLLVNAVILISLAPFGLTVVLAGIIAKSILTFLVDRNKDFLVDRNKDFLVDRNKDFLVDRNKERKDIARHVADAIHEAFQREHSKIKLDIRQQLNDYFKETLAGLEDLLENEVKAKEKVTIGLLEQQRSGNVDAEISRLSEIDACLTEQWEAISQLVYGEVVPEDATRPGGNVSDAADPVG